MLPPVCQVTGFFYGFFHVKKSNLPTKELAGFYSSHEKTMF